MRHTTYRLSIFVIAIVLGASTVLLAQDKSSGQWKFEVKEGQELNVNLETGGSVTIEGWSKKSVEIKAYAAWGDESDIDVEAVKSSRGVSLTTSNPFSWRDYGWGDDSPDIDFVIMVPQKFDLELESHGGDFKISSVEGNFEGQTMGGDIELEKLKGHIDLGTMGGDINLTDSELSGRVHTMGGDVTLKDVSGGVKGSTMGGDVRYSGKNNAKNADPIKINTMGGDIVLDDAPAGGEVKTMGGDITIKRASKHISARTMGGDIEIKELNGSVRATTMGGDVEIRMVGDIKKFDRDVEIVSKGGDVTLLVPADLSMEVDITISYTRSGMRNVGIDTDFDIVIEEDDANSNRRGRRRYIYGKGKIKDGKHKIHIETVNGRVILRKI